MGNEQKSSWAQWVLSILLGIIGWLMIMTYGSISQKLTDIQAELMSLKIQVTQIQASEMTEARVREICEMEILKKLK